MARDYLDFISCTCVSSEANPHCPTHGNNDPDKIRWLREMAGASESEAKNALSECYGDVHAAERYIEDRRFK